jgi:hypothetical protein
MTLLYDGTVITDHNNSVAIFPLVLNSFINDLIPISRLAMFRALRAAFLTHQVEQLEKSVSASQQQQLQPQS